jgi:hypothetical protein
LVSHLQQTEWNVRDIDGTVLFSIAPILSGGSTKTVEFARKHNKAYMAIDAGQQIAAQSFQTLLEDKVVKTLNVVGPRASQEPNVAQFVTAKFAIVGQRFEKAPIFLAIF